MDENLDDFVNEATGKNADSSSFTVEQLFAIKKAGEVGKRLQEDFPEIADHYRNGMTMPKISREYFIQEMYNTSESVALSAVNCALGGYYYYYDFDEISYPGLIEDPEERRNIGLEHKRENGKALYELGLGFHSLTPEQRRENGKAAYELGLGVHGMTTEQRRETGRKSGKAAYELGLGVHGMTPKERSENCRKATMARGLVPWVPAEETKEYYTFSEVETAYRLAQCLDYRNGSRIKNAEIAGELNKIFHDGEPVRVGTAVGSQLSRYQKNMHEAIK